MTLKTRVLSSQDKVLKNTPLALNLKPRSIMRHANIPYFGKKCIVNY